MRREEIMISNDCRLSLTFLAAPQLSYACARYFRRAILDNDKHNFQFEQFFFDSAAAADSNNVVSLARGSIFVHFSPLMAGRLWRRQRRQLLAQRRRKLSQFLSPFNYVYFPSRAFFRTQAEINITSMRWDQKRERERSEIKQHRQKKLGELSFELLCRDKLDQNYLCLCRGPTKAQLLLIRKMKIDAAVLLLRGCWVLCCANLFFSCSLARFVAVWIISCSSDSSRN